MFLTIIFGIYNIAAEPIAQFWCYRSKLQKYYLTKKAAVSMPLDRKRPYADENLLGKEILQFAPSLCMPKFLHSLMVPDLKSTGGQ